MSVADCKSVKLDDLKTFSSLPSVNLAIRFQCKADTPETNAAKIFNLPVCWTKLDLLMRRDKALDLKYPGYQAWNSGGIVPDYYDITPCNAIAVIQWDNNYYICNTYRDCQQVQSITRDISAANWYVAPITYGFEHFVVTIV